MRLFNYFKKQPEPAAPAELAEPSVIRSNAGGPEAAEPLPDIDEKVFIEATPPPAEPVNDHFLTTPTSQTNMDTPAPQTNDNNIALLYAFLDRNHESKGYDDALLNPDTSHLNQNLDALKNDLIRTINKVKMFYDDFIQETDYHILSRSRSGMVDIVEELEMKKRIAMGHMEKVKEIESDAVQDRGDSKGMLISYTRGFKNGLAAISHHTILTKRF